MTIAVTGANGFVGSHVIEHFLSMGCGVRGLVRRTSNLRWIDRLPISLEYGDLADHDALRRLASGADVVIHCAARTTAPSQDAMLCANAEGTANLLAACREAGTRRFLFLSSEEVVGDSGTPEPLSEAVPLRPITSYGRSKAIAEDRVRRSGLPFVILRPGPVYGPRDTDVYLYFRMIDSGIRPVPPGSTRVSVCAWSTLVSAIDCACRRDTSTGGTYFVADGGSYTWDELTALIADAVDRKALRVPLPRWVLGLAALGSRGSAALTGNVPILNKEKIQMFDVSTLAVSIARGQRDLGFTPSDTRRALEETAQWYREQGWLRRSKGSL